MDTYGFFPARAATEELLILSDGFMILSPIGMMGYSYNDDIIPRRPYRLKPTNDDAFDLLSGTDFLAFEFEFPRIAIHVIPFFPLLTHFVDAYLYHTPVFLDVLDVFVVVIFLLLFLLLLLLLLLFLCFDGIWPISTLQDNVLSYRVRHVLITWICSSHTHSISV